MVLCLLSNPSIAKFEISYCLYPKFSSNSTAYKYKSACSSSSAKERASFIFAKSVFSSIFKIYDEICVTEQSLQNSILSFRLSLVWNGIPIIRSREILLIPAFLALSTVSFASSAVWILPSSLSSLSTALCIPTEILLNPFSLNKSKSIVLPLSGFTSTVISASFFILKSFFTASKIPHKRSAPKTLGVPPPKYMVFKDLSHFADQYFIISKSLATYSSSIFSVILTL